MSEKKIDNIIHAYFKELSHQGINVEQIFLYGSQVRGTGIPMFKFLRRRFPWQLPPQPQQPLCQRADQRL
jgi:hypothetical protein